MWSFQPSSRMLVALTLWYWHVWLRWMLKRRLLQRHSFWQDVCVAGWNNGNSAAVPYCQLTFTIRTGCVKGCVCSCFLACLWKTNIFPCLEVDLFRRGSGGISSVYKWYHCSGFTGMWPRVHRCLSLNKGQQLEIRLIGLWRVFCISVSVGNISKHSSSKHGIIPITCICAAK